MLSNPYNYTPSTATQESITEGNHSSLELKVKNVRKTVPVA